MKILENPQTSRARIPVQGYVVFLAGKVFWGRSRFLVLQEAVRIYLGELAAGNINRTNNRLILRKGFYKYKTTRAKPSPREVGAMKKRGLL